MDPMLRYAILSACILVIGMIPFSIIRLYMYTTKSYLLLSKTAQRMSLVINLLSFILFIGLLIYYTFQTGFLSATFYIVMVLTFVLTLLIYKRLDMRPLENRYIVSYTKPGSQKRLLKNLSTQKAPHIATISTFSFLTHIKFLGLNPEDKEEIEKEIYTIDNVFISFHSVYAYILLGFYVALVSFSFVCFIIFFNVLLT